MEIDALTVLGIVAGTLTTTSYLPQVLKAYRTKHTKDISVQMFLLLLFGISLWLVYGAMKRDLPIVIANSFSLLFIIAMLVLKFKHG